MPLPYIHKYTDRHGHERHYFRKRGHKKVTLPGPFGSEAFMLAYHAALESAKDGPQAPKPSIGENRNPRDSIAHWVSLYLESSTFSNLAFDTRRTRRNLLERFRQKHGDKRAATLSQATLERMVANLSPVVARNFLKALRPWMKWCVKQNLRADDPTLSVERPAYTSDGYKTWPEEFIRLYRDRHPVGTRARLAFELFVNTGAAKGDVIRLGPQHIRNGVLSFRRSKTGVLVEIPVLTELQAILARCPVTALNFVLTERGTQFNDAAFGNWFRLRCNEAGIPVGYSAHGIRKYAATLRANLGATAHELMAWFGWLTMREAERYTRSAERRRLAIGLGHRVNTSKATW